MRLRPDHRYLAVLAAIQTEKPAPTEARAAALLSLLDNGECALTEVEYAHDLHEQEEHRAVLDAFLLTKCPFNEVAELLDIEPHVIETYAFLFMDTTVFRNRLEIISFASRYEGGDYGKELVKTAVNVGPDYLYWTYGHAQGEFDPRVIVKRTMIDSYYRGMAHKGNALTTGVAKEAHKWWSSAVKNAELSERMSPSTAKHAVEELRIALTQKDETVTAEAFEVPLDQILH